MSFWHDFFQVLTLQAGHNALVALLGSVALGGAAGAVGVFVLLRKRALVSDAISHATLPGIPLAFVFGVYVFGDGRSLPLLLIGAALSAWAGVLAVEWMVRRTKLTEDAAIGTVLSTFFALGVVLLTILQSSGLQGQAGLSTFILGSAAGLLMSDVLTIFVAALVVCALIALFFKQFQLLCFDPDFAAAQGMNVARLDRILLALLLCVVVIGLKTVGLVLVIALTIIPPVAARFWTDRAGSMVLISAVIGAAGAYLGTGLSSVLDNVPTGGVIVLFLFSFFVLSLLFASKRGVVASVARQWRFQRLVHERQGLLALARREPIFDAYTRRILKRRGYLRADDAPTDEGAAMAQTMARDQALWNAYRASYPIEATGLSDWSLRPIEDVLPADLVASLANSLRLSAVPDAKEGR